MLARETHRHKDVLVDVVERERISRPDVALGFECDVCMRTERLIRVTVCADYVTSVNAKHQGACNNSHRHRHCCNGCK